MLNRNKPADIHHRAEMLERFLVMELSLNLQDKISDTFEEISNDTETLENHARKINEILDSTTSEEEILAKVKEL